jgi:molecular chaperone DnaK
MSPVIGIDFGTTNSLCAWLDGDRPSVIPNARGARATPSVVAFTAKGETLVGESAKNQAYINPENTISGVKRLLGSGSLLSMGGKSWRVEEIVAIVLSSLKRDAEAYLGCPVERAAITAPAHFSDLERRALSEAGRIAGLEILRIVNEPTAAALARAWEESKAGASSEGEAPSLVLVYDFGGGTFDVTLLSRKGEECRVLASRGDGRLGGTDIDREISRLATERFKREGLDPDADRFLAQQLIEAAERAKIELSERPRAPIALAFAHAGGRIVHPSFELSRDELEALAGPFVERSLDLVERVLRDAGVDCSRVDSLVLSGGSSRMPIVRRLLEERLAIKPEGAVNPEEIVAQGAAVCAELASGSSEAARRLKVRDVVSRTYGVEIDGGAFFPLIRKNSPVPASQSRLFTTVADEQDSVEIHVLQGESPQVSENLSLGRFLLAGIGSAKAGMPRVRVDFSIDESDMLHVQAVDLGSGREQAISISDLDRGASDEGAAELAAKTALLAARLTELASSPLLERSLERGLEAEIEELEGRARAAASGGERLSEGALRRLKAELEGMVGELLARGSESRGFDREWKTASAAGPAREPRP